MIQFAYIIVFVISVASVAFGILLSYQLRRDSQNTIFIQVLYQQILIYAFSLYGIWGHVLSGLLLSSEISNAVVLERLSTIVTLLAYPFIMGSWWFLLLVSFGIKSKTKVKKNALYALLLSFAIAVGILFFLSKQSLFSIIVTLFAIQNIVINTIVARNWMICKNLPCSWKVRYGMVLFVFLSGILISGIAWFYSTNNWLTLLFILIFFVFNTWQPVFLRYFIIIEKDEVKEERLVLPFWVEKYGITPREMEIVEQVCAGKTNQEIAEKLFITLQTVKDHTSRIYLKTGVKNRTQLSNLARG